MFVLTRKVQIRRFRIYSYCRIKKANPNVMYLSKEIYPAQNSFIYVSGL